MATQMIWLAVFVLVCQIFAACLIISMHRHNTTKAIVQQAPPEKRKRRPVCTHCEQQPYRPVEGTSYICAY